jgi:hypothetical protein
MQLRRPLIPSFQAFLLMSAASLTLFLPAAVSMNSVCPSMARKTIRPTASMAPAPYHHENFNILARQIGLVALPTHRNIDPMAPHNEIKRRSLKKTKGSLALQTAAIVGSSAAIEAAKAAGQGTAAIAVRRVLKR